jgi:hypothetical protein
MTIADAVSLGLAQKMLTILENVDRIILGGPLPTPEYDMQVFFVCLQNKFIREGDQTYMLTTKGEEKMWELADLVYATRSKNNNVFVYSSYWGMWSRVLFHRSDTKLARKYGLETQNWIELDLTAINPTSIPGWRDGVQHTNIRCHSTTRDAKDKIVGTLPGHVVKRMREYLTEDATQKLLHADYLPYIDFEKGRKANNGGFHFADATKDFTTLPQYHAQCKYSGGGDGLLLHDVREDYDVLKEHWDQNIDNLIIKGGLKNAEE